MNSSSSCATSDSESCLSLSDGWYFTYDGYSISAVDQTSDQSGIYCYSEDFGNTCN